MQKLQNSPSYGWIAYDLELSTPLTCGTFLDEELIPNLKEYFSEYRAAYNRLTPEDMDASPFSPYHGSSFLGFARQQDGSSFVILAATRHAFEAAERGDPSNELRAEMDDDGRNGVCWTDSDAIECYLLNLHLEDSTDVETVGRFDSFAEAECAMMEVLTAMTPEQLKNARETGEFYILQLTLDGVDHYEPGSIFRVNKIFPAKS